MKRQALGFGLFSLGLFSIAALASAAPAGPGDRPAPPIQFLIDKDAFAAPVAQAETLKSDLLSRFSVRLYGGYCYIGAADVNAGSRGFIDLLETYGGLGFGTFNGGYNPVHGGFDAGIDLVYQVTPAIGIGLGAGFIRHTQDSEASLLGASYNMITRVSPTVSAVPVRLGAFYTIPISARVDLTAELGGAYYAGLEFDLEETQDDLSGHWRESQFSGGEAGSSKFGVHGSLGLEYKLSAKMGVFIQAAGRYAKLGNFGTAWVNVNDWVGGGTIDGKLYLRTSIGSLGSNSSFLVYATPPASDEDTIYREPKFDLSGFSLQLGIRIRL
jgi:hypothetical protein